MKSAYIYDTKIGRVLIAEDDFGITDLSLVKEKEGKDLESDFIMLETVRIQETASQLTEYLMGIRTEFQIILNLKGTDFQKKVWEALSKIPYGETHSYKQVAAAIGNPKASRAVGMANHHNPIMCIIPCHRVVGTNGSLVGYAGGLQVKEQLLNLEKKKGSREIE